MGWWVVLHQQRQPSCVSAEAGRNGARQSVGQSVHALACSRSAPPHGGGDIRPAAFAAVPWVSIRAPARGATCRDNGCHALHLVSIRAPARGATLRLPN